LLTRRLLEEVVRAERAVLPEHPVLAALAAVVARLSGKYSGRRI
jgi:hypothetical protein